MTTERFKQLLIDSGWRIWHDKMGHPPYWYATKPNESDAPECFCNGVPPQLVVTPHAFPDGHSSAELGLSAYLPDGTWINLKSRFLSYDGLLSGQDHLGKILKSAWTAAYNAAKDEQ